VIEYLHLCLGGPGLESASLRNKEQGKHCLEIPFPGPHNVSELSTLGMPSDTTDLHLKEKLNSIRASLCIQQINLSLTIQVE
jgi:hypothetical protein